MKREQILKILKVAIIATLIMLITDGIFSIPAVNDWFSGLITGASGIVVYVVVWIIMFLQVTILNIPAYVILSASVSVGINTLSFTYILVVLSAYMCGCILAYWLGRKFGKKAVKWCAGSEEDYVKWSEVLNKKGKWWYFATVVFPMFPDDILCLVAGAVKFNFGWYALFNFIGRGIGLVTTLLCLKLLNMTGGDFPFTVIVWAVGLLAEIVIYFVLKHKENKRMNLIIIGNNIDEIALDIWKANTNYTVLNQSPYVWSKEFKKFIKGRPVIVTTTSDQFLDKNINDVLDFMKKNEFIPVIIADNKKSIENNIYTGLSEEIPSTVLYTKNKQNKDYDTLIRITQGYLLGKGIIENGNKTLRTPRKRKTTASKE